MDTRQDMSEARQPAEARSLLDIERASEIAASPASAHQGTAARPDIAVPPDTAARLGTGDPSGTRRFQKAPADNPEEQRPEDKASSGIARRPEALADIAAWRRAFVPASVARELVAQVLADTAPGIVDQAQAERLLAAAQEGARPAIYPAGPARGADLVPPCDTLPSARRGATPPRPPHPHQLQVANVQSPKFLAAFSLCCSQFQIYPFLGSPARKLVATLHFMTIMPDAVDDRPPARQPQKLCSRARRRRADASYSGSHMTRGGAAR